ncbi:MAG TPA: GntR family transcriptional regulator [Streptosporangiaceae bacterium]
MPYAITYVIDMDGPQSIALQLGLADQPAGRGIYLSKSNFMAALLRELIISGELKPGVQLRQRDLAERFGVSVTPVREALRWLESEGLVRYDAHKGSTVVEAEAGATREKYQIRAVLEGLAAFLAAPRISDEDIRELESYNERLAGENLRPGEVNDLNRTLHFRVYEMAGSPLLLTLMRLLWQSFPQGPQVARPRDESVAEHKELIEALRDRDAVRAQAITQQHILGAIRYLE